MIFKNMSSFMPCAVDHEFTHFKKNSTGWMAKTFFCGDIREYGQTARRERLDGDDAGAQEAAGEEKRSAGAGGGEQESRGSAGRSMEKSRRKEEQACWVWNSTHRLLPPPSTLPSPLSLFDKESSFTSFPPSSIFQK